MSLYIDMKIVLPLNCSGSHCDLAMIFWISSRMPNVVNPVILFMMYCRLHGRWHEDSADRRIDVNLKHIVVQLSTEFVVHLKRPLDGQHWISWNWSGTILYQRVCLSFPLWVSQCLYSWWCVFVQTFRNWFPNASKVRTRTLCSQRPQAVRRPIQSFGYETLHWLRFCHHLSTPGFSS